MSSSTHPSTESPTEHGPLGALWRTAAVLAASVAVILAVPGPWALPAGEACMLAGAVFLFARTSSASLPARPLRAGLHLAAGWVGALGASAALARWAGASPQAAPLAALRETWGWWGTALWVAVLPALAEEILFRGYLQQRLCAGWGSRNGLLLTALFFAASHGSPLRLGLPLLLLGLGLGLARRAGGSLAWPVAGHLLNNLLALGGGETVAPGPAAAWTGAAAAAVSLAWLWMHARCGSRSQGR